MGVFFSNKKITAVAVKRNSEGTRFELAVSCDTHRFQRCALDHSANLP